MQRRTLIAATTVLMSSLGAGLATTPVRAQALAPDAFVRQLSGEVIDAVRTDKAIQSGDVTRIRTLVDTKVMPHVNFDRMTAMSVGPQWRAATPEQRKRMLEEYKTLLINTYSGALTQFKDQSVVIKPLRAGSGDSDVIVRSEVRGQGEPIQLDYRLEKNGEGWKIYDVNVGGFWVVDAYKGQFAKDLNNGGLDALIGRLADKNKAQPAASKS